ncbi:hypothetical protein F0562_002755 [Nyssa sinensis]|uniref:Bidirectional sugar transporter SWEET n=1 Tax=Nyssa sinensis TaxID=561372 RepID=A0A5J5BUX3_9ASTE|nr:hypothetical protein F0562_002755 [Nyssa sinensis]
MTLLNCLLFAWYGLPFVSPHNILLSIINVTGAAIELIYVLIFLRFAPNKEKRKIFGLFTFVLAVFSAVAFVSIFALHGNKRKLFCGFAATIFCIIMFASPLSIMVPNGFGCGLGAAQLILYAIYGDNKGETKKASSTSDGSMEMGLGKPHPLEMQSITHPSQDRQI